MDEERRILYYLDPFFTNLKEKIILSIFFQYNSLSYDNLFEKLNQKISINRYDIEFFLLKLISEGWISSDSSNNSFKKNDLFKLGPNLAIKSQLEALIEQTNDKLIHQKQKFYGISQLLKFKENGKSLSKSLEMLELSAMPDSYPIILKDHIYFLQQTLPNSIFKFEKNNLISFPLKNISFRLYSVEIGYLEDKEMKYGGIFLNQMVDGINRDEIIQQIHQYHRNNLHIKYKLEIGGYYGEKTREITQLEFDESSKSEEKSGWIVSNYLFFLSKQKINCTLQTFSIKIEDTFILTIFAESPRLFNYLNQIIYNNEN